MKKLILCLAFFTAAALIFAGCSAESAEKNESNTVSNTSEAAAQTQGSEPETSTVLDENNEPVPYAISEEEARAAAFNALKTECAEGKFAPADIEAFEWDRTELLAENESCLAFNNGYGNTVETENRSGHSYYSVYYTDTTQIAGFAYVCVDAVTGDILFINYMGD